jgi:hypothetical protein
VSRLRNNYAIQGLFVGPAPASGFSFINYSGNLNDNDASNLNINHNLLMKIDGLYSFNHEFSPAREDIKMAGVRSLAARPTINPPSISLSFEYLINGLKNDARLGLDVNYSKFEYPYSGQGFYSYRVCPISGLVERRLLPQFTGEPYWPLVYKDCRNLYLIITDVGTDLFGDSRNEDFSGPDTFQEIDTRSTGFKVFSFGNSYLTSYTTSAAVGGFPTAKVTYVAENVCVSTSGNRVFTPAINTQTRQMLSGKTFSVPKTWDEGGPNVILPGDITLSISGSGEAFPFAYGLDLNDVKVDQYSIQFDLNRQPLRSVGFDCPIDRKVTFPVMATLEIGMIVGDFQTANYLDSINNDRNYFITIRLKNPSRCAPFNLNDIPPRNAGFPLVSGADVAVYDFINAKCVYLNNSDDVSTNKRAIMRFEVEIDPDNLNHGLFISGLLNIEKIEDFILNEDGTYLLNEDSTLLVNNLRPLF